MAARHDPAARVVGAETVWGRLAWVCLGGAAGSGARYLVQVWAEGAFGAAFPYGTLLVNLLGSFLLGALLEVGFRTDWLAPTSRLALGTGVLGGFTTYSTFNYDTIRLIEARTPGLAGLNVLATVSGCLLAGTLGAAVARWAVGR